MLVPMVYVAHFPIYYSMLCKVMADHQRDWDQSVPTVMAAYRTSPHSATKVSPNRLIFGREISMPVDIVLGRPEQERAEAESYEDFADDLASRLEALLNCQESI